MKRVSWIVQVSLILWLLVGGLSPYGTAWAEEPPDQEEFVLAAPQGFGDRHNSWAWSMQWWNGHLYVGTNRAFRCAEFASLNHIAPSLFPYPPEDPDIECTPDPTDLPLQAEIWRWTPETDSWERVYQAPADVQLPNGKWVARDIGYRGMTVFREPDGTEALYVTGVSPQFLGFEGVEDLPARILRSTDGVHFEPIPQDPGTALGNFPFAAFRNPTGYKGKFYVVGGMVQGSGVLLESETPAEGNDSFRVVSPSDMIVSAVAVYNGYLYLGLRDLLRGYAVAKTDASGEPPYTFTIIVDQGGNLDLWRNPEVLSMQVFDGRLYVGGNGLIIGPLGIMGPAELIRINPDDSWDLIVGYPRRTPDGWKFPLSGLTAGFGNFLNGHMWRMEVYEGELYVGTFDSSTTFKDDPDVAPLVQSLMGFDLYRTANGVDFMPVSTTGFGDPFNFGVRTMAATPHGLFIGTANPYYGLQIWLKRRYGMFLPLLVTSPAPSLRSYAPPQEETACKVASGDRRGASLYGEPIGGAVVLSWRPLRGAAAYRIWRSQAGLATFAPEGPRVQDEDMLTLEVLKGQRPSFTDIGQTSGCYYVDQGVHLSQRSYLYLVEGIDAMGRSVGWSHLTAVPGAAPSVTFSSLIMKATEAHAKGYLSSAGFEELRQRLEEIRWLLRNAHDAAARQRLAALRERLSQPGGIFPASWMSEDFLYLVDKLERRVDLMEKGFIEPMDLE